jgi:flagellar L-ring protein precursor FlgH
MEKQGMKTLVLFVFMVLCGGLSMDTLAQDMRENVGRSLFSDQKANRIGDAVTVFVVEVSSASNDAKTTSSRESNLSLSASNKSGTGAGMDISAGLGVGNQFRGEGATSSRGSVRAKISARVDSVMPNGNLMITGNRTITVNGEEQTIKISGVVRPSDVQADNSVYSYNISDAVIVFEGNGIVSRAQGPGWLTKLLHWLL